MDRDPRENVVDPVERSTPTTGQNDTGEVGAERKRIMEKRRERGTAPEQGEASMPPPGEVDAHRANEWDSRKGLAGAEAKGYRGLDEEKRKEAENPGQQGKQSGEHGGAGSTGASHRDSGKREGS